ncbi:MAG TPA: tRNA (adenosine(37)-N6)-dimethylallyltransferase MiaA [Egibacteraceae bacterium]
MTSSAAPAAPEAAPVLALVGPTGVGKSAIALAVAERLDAEIVAVDAFTVYRGMDIGTAKPSPAELAGVRHHLVDALDPVQECTVQWFQQAARAAIADVLARGRTPLLVGGSGLYWRAVVDPLEFPPTDPAVRAAVAARFDGDAAAAHAALRTVDPDAAARIDPGNLRRSVRALEVLELTGRRFSDWHRAWDRYDASLYPGLRVVGVDLPRDELRTRLDARVDAMLARGWLEECRRLAQQPLSRTARQAIGYAELFDHLAGAVTLAEAVAHAKTRTRRYAGRQRRWFAADPRVEWVTAEDAAVALAAAALPPSHGR